MKLSPSEATRLLMITVQTGNTTSIRFALESGAKVNHCDRKGRSPLIRACRAPDPDPRIVRMLLAAGADALASDTSGKNALDHARLELIERGSPHDDPEAVAHDRDRAARALDMPEEELMQDFELEMLAEREKEMPPEEFAEFRARYVASRREAASRDWFDTSKIERVIKLLEEAQKGGAAPPAKHQ